MSNDLMKAAVLDKPMTLEVKQVKRPSPGPDEALLKVYCIGVFRYANTYPAAIQALKSSDIDLRHSRQGTEKSNNN